MKELYALARQSPLFWGIDKTEFEEMQDCLRSRVSHYRREEVLLQQGDVVRDAGILLCGEAQPSSESINGEHSVAHTLRAGDVFGGVLMSAENMASPVRITALTDLSVLYIPYEGIMQGCCRNCKRHVQLRSNLLQVISKKFLLQNQQLQILKLKSVRERILLFLSDARRLYGSQTFSIDYDRETLAAFLGVNRSALSRELSRMRDEEILTYYKNSFKLLK